MLVWGVMRFLGIRVPEFDNQVSNIAVHCGEASAFSIVPGAVYACIYISFTFPGDVIMFLEDIADTMNMLFTHIFDAKVIYNESKYNRMPFFSPKAWCGETLVLTMFDKMFLKEVYGKYFRLWESINDTANFEVDPTITHVFVKVLFINKFLRNVSDIDVDILGAFQRSLEVDVDNVGDDVIGVLA